MTDSSAVKHLRSGGLASILVGVLAFAAGGCHSDAATLAANQPAISAVCKGGELAACPQDAKIVFRVNGLSGNFFLTAYTENVASGELAWIAPGADDDPTPVSVFAGDHRLARVVPMALLAKGDYLIHALLTAEPLTRNDVLSGKVKIVSAATSTTALTVTRKSTRVHSVFE